jgi:hypothetical protein
MGYNRAAFVLHTHIRSLLGADKATTYHGDDFQHWGSNKEDSQSRRERNRDTLQEAGESKHTPPTQRTDILGVEVDLKLKATRTSSSTRAKYLPIFRKALDLPQWNQHDVQVLLGMIEWLVYGDPLYRPMSTELVFALGEDSWTFEAAHYHDTLRRITRRLEQNPWSQVPKEWLPMEKTQLVYTDASDWGMAVVTNQCTQGMLAPEGMHINETEALAVEKALHTAEGPVTIYCDNTATIGALRKGRSKNATLNKVAVTYMQRKTKHFTNIMRDLLNKPR